MTTAYFDSSALVKRYVNEVGSAWVRRALAHPTEASIYTALLTYAEVLSALQRKVRERELPQDRATVLAQRVLAHCTWRYHRLLPISLREFRFALAYSPPYEKNPMTWRL